MNKHPVSQPKKKILPGKTAPIIGVGILGLGILWVVITAIAPLITGNGVSNYSGVEKDLAKRIVDSTQQSNGPASPSLMPDFMYRIHVDEIRPVTKEEITEFCKDPSYIFDDFTDFHYYSATVTEGYLLSLAKKTTHYIGCNATDHLHGEIFGDPKGTIYTPLPR